MNNQLRRQTPTLEVSRQELRQLLSTVRHWQDIPVHFKVLEPGVAANTYLVSDVRRLAIKDELLAMRLLSRLVAPLVVRAARQPIGKG